MPYIAPEVITEAKRMDLLTYLREYEPGELVILSFIGFLLSCVRHFALIGFAADNFVFSLIHIEQNIQLVQSGKLCFQFFLLDKWFLDFFLCGFQLIFGVLKVIFRKRQALGKSLNSVIEADNIAVCVIAERNISACRGKAKVRQSDYDEQIPGAFCRGY